MNSKEIIKKLQGIESMTQFTIDQLYEDNIKGAKSELQRLIINIVDLQCDIVEDDPSMDFDDLHTKS